MAYLQEFQQRIERNEFSRFLQLWEEYALNDQVDADELQQLLEMIKTSEMAKTFGKYVETALPIWELIQDEKASYNVLRLLIDLQTTNSPKLGELALAALQKKHGEEPEFRQRLRLIGLRNLERFEGAISNYELLAHLAPGKFVFHTGGWGTGEVMGVSPVLQQVNIEFENFSGKRDISFENAFKMLTPLPDDHFLSRRFGDPDSLEEEAKQKPQEVIRLLLRDLGPKTAAEIKEELAEWVIPEQDWSKWWQGARAKIKKDTMVETPSSLRKPFRLRSAAVSHEERMHEEIHDKTELSEILQTTYSYVRDFPSILRKEESKKKVIEKLTALLSHSDLTPDFELQTVIFLEQIIGDKVEGKSVSELIQQLDKVEEVIEAIEIQALKKRALIALKKHRKDWEFLFFQLLFKVEQSALRDYIFDQLNQKETAARLEQKIEELIHHPANHPEVFVWYFQKAIGKKKVPFSDKEGQCRCLEALLILLHKIESISTYRDLTKKIYNILTGKRFATTRAILSNSSLSFVKEFLLLVAKCHSLDEHDTKIMHSLAEVVHPELADKKKKSGRIPENVVWTTEKGYHKTQEAIRQLGTVDLVETAKEIEVARAHGDLRENAEYKAALEKRSRLQAQLKMLSDQFQRARIISKEDISTEEVSVGTIVDLEDSRGNRTTYTILGPWDADPDTNLLSFQSKLAQAMLGLKKKDSFEFREDKYTILDIKSTL